MKSYQEILTSISGKRNHLLLGNGFSIACSNVFSYGSLYKKAVDKGLSENAKKVFEYFGTNNFEGVMHALENADWIGKQYSLIDQRSLEIKNDVELIKRTLIDAIAESHLAFPGEIKKSKYLKAIKFIEPYHNIFTTNYDLLPYWIDMCDELLIKYQDGFRTDIDEPEAGYVVFSEHTRDNKGLFYLHGALHLYQCNGSVRKHCWERTGKRLIELIKEGLNKKEYPLFVAEGKAEKKLQQINENGYLSYCYGKLKRIQNNLVIYGSSLGTSDQHIADAIAENQDIKKVFFGIYDESDTVAMLQIQKTVERMKNRREIVNNLKPLEVEFYDSKTADIW
jgi:hypothetical protein